jgi:hypothetical protein
MTTEKIGMTITYENYKPCPELQSGELCLVVEQYREGQFDRQFHEHIPRTRLSADGKANLLRALVIKFGGIGPEQIVRAYLNTKGKRPPADNGLRIHTSYPEAGVLRHYCGTNTHAWIDDVIAPSKFRGA